MCKMFFTGYVVQKIEKEILVYSIPYSLSQDYEEFVKPGYLDIDYPSFLQRYDHLKQQLVTDYKVFIGLLKTEHSTQTYLQKACDILLSDGEDELKTNWFESYNIEPEYLFGKHSFVPVEEQKLIVAAIGAFRTYRRFEIVIDHIVENYEDRLSFKKIKNGLPYGYNQLVRSYNLLMMGKNGGDQLGEMEALSCKLQETGDRIAAWFKVKNVLLNKLIHILDLKNSQSEALQTYLCGELQLTAWSIARFLGTEQRSFNEDLDDFVTFYRAHNMNVVQLQGAIQQVEDDLRAAKQQAGKCYRMSGAAGLIVVSVGWVFLSPFLVPEVGAGVALLTVLLIAVTVASTISCVTGLTFWCQARPPRESERPNEHNDISFDLSSI